MKRELLFWLIILMGFSNAIPVPVSVEGIAYNLEGEQLVNPYVSLRNVDNGYFIEGYAGRGSDPGKYLFTVKGDVGNNLVLTVVQGRNSESRTFVLEGVMKNVNLYLNDSLEGDLVEIISEPILIAEEDSSYQYFVDVNSSLEISYFVSGPEGMFFDNNVLRWMPGQEDVGVHDIVITVTDGELSDYQSFTLEVIEVNDAPKIISGPLLSTYEDEEYTYEIYAIDEENDDLTYVIISGPSGMNISGNVVMWLPKQEDVGLHNITIFVSDGSSGVSQNYLLEVIEVNDAPKIISKPPTSVLEDEEYFYAVLVSDDSESLNLSLVVAPASAYLSEGILYWLPKQEDVGDVLFVLRVSDGELSTNQSFVLNVIEVNDAPKIISSPETSAMVGDEYTYEILAEDEETDDLLYGFDGPDNSKIEGNILSWKPRGNQVGEHEFYVLVNDGNVSVKQEFLVDVKKRNKESPVFLSLDVEILNHSSEAIEVSGVKSPFEIAGFVESRRAQEIKIRNINSGEEYEVISNPEFEGYYSQLVYGKAGDELEIEVDGNLLTGYVLKDQSIDFDTFNEFRPLYAILPLIVLALLILVWRVKK